MLGVVLLITVLRIIVVLISLRWRCCRRRTGAALRCERIGLPDQAGEFGQGITLRSPMLIATATKVIGR